MAAAAAAAPKPIRVLLTGAAGQVQTTPHCTATVTFAHSFVCSAIATATATADDARTRQIGYALIPHLVNGTIFGAQQPVILHLLDIKVSDAPHRSHAACHGALNPRCVWCRVSFVVLW